jgi:hypothetical protein
MPSIKPRISIVCDKALYAAIAEIAEREGGSLQSVVHELLLESLELREDAALSTVADQRSKSFDLTTAFTADQAFG